jgi:23S rRNA-/tRNA-specific pseudouridylate synthase
MMTSGMSGRLLDSSSSFVPRPRPRSLVLEIRGRGRKQRRASPNQCEPAKPHFINRLDRETSGIVVAAKKLLSARELGRLWETRAARTLVCGLCS